MVVDKQITWQHLQQELQHGFGCTLMIIDDLIKNVQEAYNEAVLQKQIDWFNNTMLSRTENNFKLIIIMTRWASNDLAGYILENFNNVRHINYKAIQDDGSMLCEDILNKEDYEFKTKNMNKDIIYANYQQEPIDIKNRLYSGFKTYEKTLYYELYGYSRRRERLLMLNRLLNVQQRILHIRCYIYARGNGNNRTQSSTNVD